MEGMQQSLLGIFYKLPRKGETINNVAEVESRAELVRALPRCSNVSEKRCGSREQSRTCSSFAEM